MKLPNLFKIFWWVLLLVVSSFFLWHRKDDLAAGRGTGADITIFLTWLAIMLAPIFQEIEFLGIKLKQSIDDLKTQIQIMKVDLQNQLMQTVNTTINNNFPRLPQDKDIPKIERETEQAVGNLGQEAVSFTDPIAENVVVNVLANLRRLIEVELRRIYNNNFEHLPARSFSIALVLSQMIEDGIITQALAKSLREIYAICSAALHGLDVSDTQFQFAAKLGPKVLAALKKIE